MSEHRDEPYAAPRPGGAPAPEDARHDAGQETGGGGPLDRLRRVFSVDERGADEPAESHVDADRRSPVDTGADRPPPGDDRPWPPPGDAVGAPAAGGPVHHGPDAEADGPGSVDQPRSVDHPEWADRQGPDGQSEPVDHPGPAEGSPADRSPADADDRLLPPPGGGPAPTPVGATPAVPAAVGATSTDRTPGVDLDAQPAGSPQHEPPAALEPPAAAGPAVPAGVGAAAADRTPDVDSEVQAPRPPQPAPPAPADSAGGAGQLLPAAEVERFRARWLEVQTGFVDSPRETVQQADGLTAELMEHLTRTFTDERSRLERQWDGGDEVATDDLRAAFQRYRSFFDRLLAT